LIGGALESKICSRRALRSLLARKVGTVQNDMLDPWCVSIWPCSSSPDGPSCVLTATLAVLGRGFRDLIAAGRGFHRRSQYEFTEYRQCPKWALAPLY
jgi:hypothetical protein